MRRRKLTIGLLSMMMAASVAFGIQGNDVHAASKKLSVNRVYENATRINGKTRKKNIVRVKIGKKTYKAKANKKGKFTSIMIRLFPQGALNVRYEQDSGNVYIRTGALKEFLAKRGVGINSVKDALHQRGLLLESGVRRVLSQGLPQNSGRSYCWVVRADDLVKSTLDQIVEDGNE